MPHCSAPRRLRAALRAALVLSLVAGTALPALAQDPLPPDPCVHRKPLFRTYADFRTEVDEITAIADVEDRTKKLDRLWNRLVKYHQVPFAVGDSLAFLYRGDAGSVLWNGDFNGWGDTEAAGTRLPGTDLWIHEATLPADARVDYKLVVDGNWILDPANPLYMYSGFGPNSELRMPDYAYPYDALRREGIPTGTLTDPIRTSSLFLAYDLQYQVYLPHNYDALSGLPTLYVADGQEYSPDHLGSLVAVLDNAIADGTVEPMVVVFIDARDPDSGSNRRIPELVANPAYLSFVAEELVPEVDAAYRTRTDAGSRGILGTSLGGLNAAYFAIMRPDVFGNAGVQSPAFWIYPAIYGLYEKPPPPGLRVYMTQGTVNDGDGGVQMKQRFDRWGYTYDFVVYNEGHAWGQWRAQLTRMLRYLYPGEVTEPPKTDYAKVCGGRDDGMNDGTEPPVAGPIPGLLTTADGTPTVEAFPNPAAGPATLRVSVPAEQRVRLEVFDAVGRRVATVFDGSLRPGAPRSFAFEGDGLPGGTYLYRATGETFSASGSLVLIR